MVPGSFSFHGGGRSRGQIVHAVEDWQAIGGGSTSASEAYPPRSKRGPSGSRMQPAEGGAGHLADYLERDGCRDRRWWSALPGQSLRIADEVLSDDRERDQRVSITVPGMKADSINNIAWPKGGKHAGPFES